MEIGVMKARPPHIRFTMKPVEDRNATIEAGHTVFLDVPHVIVTPQGSKDSVEKPVKEWLESVDQQVREDRMPGDWAEKFHQAFAHWKRGEEIPVEGTPLSNWGSISPAELATCKGIHILTLEDLSTANDEAVRRMGMGGLALKQRAKKFMEAAAGPGKLLEENRALQQKFETAEERRLELETRIAQLEALVGKANPVKVTAPAAELAAKIGG